MEETKSTEDEDPQIDIYPPEPTKPLDSECCGTGCTPCVFDIYDKQLSQWKLQCDAIRRGCSFQKSSSDCDDDDEFLTPEKYKALKILKIFQETENMKIFRFSWPESSIVQFPVKLGQHLLIKMGDSVSRPYSILRTDPEHCFFDILIKIYTSTIRSDEENNTEDRKILTPILDGLKEGDEIMVRGPFGRVFNNENDPFSHLICIAAGTGIAPICRIIESILGNEDDETRIKLLFSCPTVKDIPLTNQFKKWSSFWNFNITYFVPFYDNGDNNALLPYHGMKIVSHRLDLDHLREQIQNIIKGGGSKTIASALFVICGTKSFEKDVINHLSKIGIESNKMILF